MMKLRPLLASLCALVFLITRAFAGTGAPLPLANDVILIIRHAEKPDDGPLLAPAGQKRALDYVHYFEHFQIDSKARPIDYLIASADSHGSERPRLTLEPLSKAIGLPLDDNIRDKDINGLAQDIEQHPGRKVILICWHHGQIPDILQVLGADPNVLLPQGKWPDNVYNWVIELQYDANGHLIPEKAKRINEHLEPGDAD